MISATEQGPSGAHGTLAGRTFRGGGTFTPAVTPMRIMAGKTLRTSPKGFVRRLK